MIKYSLICDKQHEFEGWFSTSDDFDAQKKRNLVNCPLCNSSNIAKTLMAPSISTSKTKTPDPVPEGNKRAKEALLTANADIPAAFNELVSQMRDLRTHIQKNSDNVGNKFPDEARKIHYGEVEKRSIYGQANAEDVKELVEEGVEVMPLPILPEDRN